MSRRVLITNCTASLVAGVDEAGRGCLAGPVYAAAVILPDGCVINGLNDSKQLSPARREALFDEIRDRALGWAIACADVGEIAALNILHASMLAMQRAVAALDPAPRHCLVDGNCLPRELPCSAEAVVQGDAIHAPIMAASILAKVARDREMTRLEAEFPGYGFAQHKGYGTAAHLAALRRFGPTVQHRMGFAPCAQMALPGIGNGESGIVKATAAPSSASDDSRFPIPDSQATAEPLP